MILPDNYYNGLDNNPPPPREKQKHKQQTKYKEK